MTGRITSFLGHLTRLRPGRAAAPEPMLSPDDDHCQAGLLETVLELHPTHLPEVELIRYLGVDEGDFRQVDSRRRAIRDLLGVGLLRREGEVISPTMGALHFATLMRITEDYRSAAGAEK